MSASEATVLGALDRPGAGQSADGLLAVGGWAMGPAAGRLQITLDEIPVELDLQWYPRPDVEAWLEEKGFEQPPDGQPGFVGMLETEGIPDGEHEIGCNFLVGGQVHPIGTVRVVVDNSETEYRFINRPDAAEALRREHIYGSGPPVDVAAPQVLALIRRYGDGPFLDLGCGVGAYVEELARAGYEITGLEINERFVETARQKGRRVLAYDGAKIPAEDAAYHTAFAIEVLEHVPDWRGLLDEMLRVAEQRVLLSVPNLGVLPGIARHRVVPWHLLESTHLNFFSPRILSNALQRLSGVESTVFTYGSIRVNGEIFDNHIFAVLTRRG